MRINEIFALPQPCLHAHVWAFKESSEDYVKTIQAMQVNGSFASLSSANRARVLATLHIGSQHQVLARILPCCEIIDIAKALTILDRPRAMRQLQNKINRLELQQGNNVDNANGTATSNERPRKCIKVGPSKQLFQKKNKLRPKRKRRKQIDKYRSELAELMSNLRPSTTTSSSSTTTTTTTGETMFHQAQACIHTHADTAVQEMIESSSVSGALARKIREWVASIPSDFLEYVVLTMPTKSWRIVADLVHFKPSNFQLVYFLSFVHDGIIPKDSFVAHLDQIVQSSSEQVQANFESTATKFPQMYNSYAFLRTCPNVMSNAKVIKHLAYNIPLETLIWYFEELAYRTKACDKILAERLQQDKNKVLLDVIQSKSKVYKYGKLVERILTMERMNVLHSKDMLLPLANTQWAELQKKFPKQKSPLVNNNNNNNDDDSNNKNKKIAIFGDASASMQSAIDAATIFASMASSCLDGELSFFGNGLIRSPRSKPSSTIEILKICKTVRAKGCTCMAAPLWPYVMEKKIVDAIVMVTDEEENSTYMGSKFAALLREYLDCVNPNTKLIIVCVGPGDEKFRESLKLNNITPCKVITIDNGRPDLTKFDALLAQIASEFGEGTKTIKTELEKVDANVEMIDTEDALEKEVQQTRQGVQELTIESIDGDNDEDDNKEGNDTNMIMEIVQNPGDLVIAAEDDDNDDGSDEFVLIDE